MIVAVVTVRVVQMAVDQIIDVVTVGHGLVPAVGTMNMADGMAAAVMRRRAGGGIRAVHFQNVFIDVIAVNVVQVAIVQVIGMAVVPNGRMPAIGTVLVGVVLVLVATLHGYSPEKGSAIPLPYSTHAVRQFLILRAKVW